MAYKVIKKDIGDRAVYLLRLDMGYMKYDLLTAADLESLEKEIKGMMKALKDFKRDE